MCEDKVNKCMTWTGVGEKRNNCIHIKSVLKNSITFLSIIWCKKSTSQKYLILLKITETEENLRNLLETIIENL